MSFPPEFNDNLVYWNSETIGLEEWVESIDPFHIDIETVIGDGVVSTYTSIGFVGTLFELEQGNFYTFVVKKILCNFFTYVSKFFTHIMLPCID